MNFNLIATVEYPLLVLKACRAAKGSPSLVLTAIFSLTVPLQAAPNFQDDIYPIFKQHCLNCHNPDKKKGDLDLTTVAAIQQGGSSGEIVKAGAPDTSYLFMVTDHHEDADPMPPKGDRVPQKQIDLLHAWIAGGLVESKGGKSQLRDISFTLESGSNKRPENPAVPSQIPALAQPDWQHTPPAVAVAASPWADVIAQAASDRILLYSKVAPKLASPGFEPFANDDLLEYRDFNADSEQGKALGARAFDNSPLELESISPDFIHQNKGFTFSSWIKPDKDTKRAYLFSNSLFSILLDPFHQGLTVRSHHRNKENGIIYHGRKGVITTEVWNHVAVTVNEDEFAFFINGEQVSRATTPEGKTGFLAQNKPYLLGASPRADEANFKGSIDDFRIYTRALSNEEVGTIYSNAHSSVASVGALAFPEGNVHDLRFSPNGDLLLAAGGIGAYSGSVAVYDVKTGKLLTTVGDEQDIVLSADITPDHQLIAIGTPAKMVKIYRVKDGKLLHRIKKHTEWVSTVSFSPDGKYLATGDRNGAIHTWETETGGIVYTLDEHKVKVTSLSWRSDGAMLASSAEDGKFVLWDMKDGWATRTASVHNQKAASRYTRRTGILKIQFLNDGRFVTVGRDKTLKLWQPDGSPAGASSELNDLPLSFAPYSQASQLVVGDIRGNLQVFDTKTLKRTGQF